MFLCITNTSPYDEYKVEENNYPIDHADGKARHWITLCSRFDTRSSMKKRAVNLNFPRAIDCPLDFRKGVDSDYLKVSSSSVNVPGSVGCPARG